MKRIKILYASDRLCHRRGSIPMEPSILLPTSDIRGAECQDRQKYDSTGGTPGREEMGYDEPCSYVLANDDVCV